MLLDLISIGLLQGLLLAIVAVGIMVPFRLLNFPDLTAEGSYPLGGVICGVLISLNMHWLLALLIASFAAGLIGIGTAILHLRFKINTLLAGIILSTMLYSVHLRLMGKPNIALFDFSSLFNIFNNYDHLIIKLIILIIINIIIIVPLFVFLITEKGLALRAVGLNSLFAQRQAINIQHYTLLGLFVGNMLCGLAGSLMVQVQGYADIGMGLGIVIHALAALMIGENIIGNKTLLRQIIAPVIGAIIYQQIQGLALSLGCSPSDLKLVSGSIVLAMLIFNKL
jgi:putative tryptophan/tyrosine transport system permease protein